MPRKRRSASPFELMDDDFDDTSSQSSRNGNPPIQRNAANARERARMRVLSSAFGRLKTKLPNIPVDTKLSKLDTLRLATMYIKQLKSIVEGGGIQIPTTNGDSIEGSLNNSNNNLTSCYLNLNSGTQCMNWPFGFHHHLSNTTSIRSNSSMSLSANNNSSNNWCHSENNNNNAHIKLSRYDNGDYQQNERQHQSQNYLQQTTINHDNQSHNQNHQHNHWYSKTPSPELDTSPNTSLAYENSHLLNQQEQQHHHYHHTLTHLQPATIHSSTFHMQHDLRSRQHRQHHHHEQHQSSTHHMLNDFVNSSNFQSTSIR